MTNKAKITQIEKYGGVAGYKAEMKRRRGLVKNFYLSQPGKAQELANKRWGNKNADQTLPG